MTTENTLTSMITGNWELFAFLWPIALGEPVGPDGDVFGYGDDQLAEWVIQMLNGETQNWPSLLSRLTSTDAELWKKGRTLIVAQVENLDDEGWARVREGLMTAHPDREIPCPYCATRVLATEDAFHKHYQQDKCWEDDDEN
jgi:hypothetical protein